jgi:hypothetical protein
MFKAPIPFPHNNPRKIRYEVIVKKDLTDTPVIKF